MQKSSTQNYVPAFAIALFVHLGIILLLSLNNKIAPLKNAKGDSGEDLLTKAVFVDTANFNYFTQTQANNKLQNSAQKVDLNNSIKKEDSKANKAKASQAKKTPESTNGINQAQKENSELNSKKAKAKATQKLTQDKQTAQNKQSLEDLFSSSQTKASQKASKSSTKAGNEDGQAELFYTLLIKKKLNRFYRTDPSFKGLECRVKIHIARNGEITNYKIISGAENVCRNAIVAITSAKDVPQASTDEIYKKYQAPIIKFGLKIN